MAAIEILDGKKFTCAFCKGTGRQPLSLKGRCFTCRGAGFVELEGPAMRCAYCSGSGKAYQSSALSCPVCLGRGVVPIKNPYELCQKCNGRGKEVGRALYCADCRGKGVREHGDTQDKIPGVLEEQLGDITEKVRRVTAEVAKKTKEIEKRIKPIKKELKPLPRRIKKETVWVKNLSSKIKKGWQSIWEE